MTREEAKRFWLIRYENAKDYTDPHWEAQERREHREYVEALRMAIESLQREDEFLKNFESNEPQVYDEGDPWNGRVPTHGRLIDADALSKKLCETTIFIKDGEVFQRMINDAPTVQADRPHGIGYVGVKDDYPVSVKEVLNITAETGALETQRRIKELQPIDRPHGDWTPVTEQLPKIDETLRLCDQISDEVLGTDTYGNIRHVYLTNCGYLKPTFCTVEEGMSVDIVAWMPTPEPYEEVER